MAKAAKKKTAKKSARVTAKPKAAAKAAKTAKKKTAKPARKAARKTAPKVDPLNRKQYTALTPMLTVKDVRAAAQFYEKAFGFTIRGIMDTPQGVMHAELRLRDTTLMLSPEMSQQQAFGANTIGDTPATLYILVDNVDEVFNSAVDAGGQVMMPVADMFWGDRIGQIKDPEGNKWMIATHKADLTEAQMAENMQKMERPQVQEAAAAAAAGSESEY